MSIDDQIDSLLYAIKQKETYYYDFVGFHSPGQAYVPVTVRGMPVFGDGPVLKPAPGNCDALRLHNIIRRICDQGWGPGDNNTGEKFDRYLIVLDERIMFYDYGGMTDES